jgi:hypothetical protein
MKIETALKHRRAGLMRLYDAYSRARLFKCTSSDLGQWSREARALPESAPRAPGWVGAYLEGADEVLREMLYREALEYCSRAPSGELVSHHRDSERYYEKRGFSPCDVATKNSTGGHYWKGTEKPFFVSGV